MARVLRVTPAQVEAARGKIRRLERNDQPVPEALRKIADARPARREDTDPAEAVDLTVRLPDGPSISRR